MFCSEKTPCGLTLHGIQKCEGEGNWGTTQCKLNEPLREEGIRIVPYIIATWGKIQAMPLASHINIRRIRKGVLSQNGQYSSSKPLIKSGY